MVTLAFFFLNKSLWTNHSPLFCCQVTKVCPPKYKRWSQVILELWCYMKEDSIIFGSNLEKKLVHNG